MYIVLFSFIVVCVAVAIWCVFPMRRRAARFRERVDLSPDEIYAKFFSQEERHGKALILDLWNEVAVILEVPPGKLRPTDRFDKELAPEKGWEYDDGIGVVNFVARMRLKKLGRADVELNRIETLEDYVLFFVKIR